MAAHFPGVPLGEVAEHGTLLSIGNSATACSLLPWANASSAAGSQRAPRSNTACAFVCRPARP